MHISGSCMCGRIAYEVNGDVVDTTWCFCITCQQGSGGPFMPFATFDSKAVTWKREPDVWSSSEMAERYMCKECGSSLGMRYHFGTDRIGLTVGTIKEKQQSGFQPTTYIFLKDMPVWFTLGEDGVERADEYNESFNKRLIEWKQTRPPR